MHTWKVWAAFTVVAGMMATAAVGAQRKSEEVTGQDRTEIEALYAEYSRLWDLPDGTAERWADTFTADGVFNKTQGRAALVAIFKGAHTPEKPWTARHWLNQLTLTRTAEGVKGMCYLMLVNIAQTPPAIQLHAIYDDDLVKTSDGWRFKKRIIR